MLIRGVLGLNFWRPKAHADDALMLFGLRAESLGHRGLGFRV